MARQRRNLAGIIKLPFVWDGEFSENEGGENEHKLAEIQLTDTVTASVPRNPERPPPAIELTDTKTDIVPR